MLRVHTSNSSLVKKGIIAMVLPQDDNTFDMSIRVNVPFCISIVSVCHITLL